MIRLIIKWLLNYPMLLEKISKNSRNMLLKKLEEVGLKDLHSNIFPCSLPLYREGYI